MIQWICQKTHRRSTCNIFYNFAKAKLIFIYQGNKTCSVATNTSLHYYEHSITQQSNHTSRIWKTSIFRNEVCLKMCYNKMLNANILGPFFFYAQFIQGNDSKSRIIWHPTQISSSFLAMPIKGFHQVKIRNRNFTTFPTLKLTYLDEFLVNFYEIFRTSRMR